MEDINLSWIRKARRNAGCTLAQAAKSIGRDRSSVWRYENGKMAMPIDVLFKLLNSYNVSIKDVIEVKEDPADAGI